MTLLVDEEEDVIVDDDALLSLPCFSTLANDTFPPHIPDDGVIAAVAPVEDTVDGDDELVVDATGDDVIAVDEVEAGREATIPLILLLLLLLLLVVVLS